MGDLADWLATLPAARAAFLSRYFDRARAIVPEAVEGTRYAMPCLAYRDRGLVAIMPTKAGYSVYPFSGVVVGALMARHPGWAHTKGSVRCSATTPLSDEVFDELVRAARSDIDRRLERR